MYENGKIGTVKTIPRTGELRFKNTRDGEYK
jgi:hypothetical protein